jgi:hypothetical protein
MMMEEITMLIKRWRTKMKEKVENEEGQGITDWEE